MTISWNDIKQLVDDRAPEGPHLDFKREPYGLGVENKPHRRDANTELRRDATAFANAGHGRIIVGIEEQAECAGAIRPVDNPIACEKYVSGVLASNIEPPFSSSDCRVYAVLNPLDECQGVVVIDLASNSGSAPRAVVEDNVIDFWVRAGKSKHRMTYFEVFSAFRRSLSAEIDQGTQGAVRHEVTKLRWRIARESKRQDSERWDDLWPAVRELVDYAKEYGFDIRQEVLSAVGELLDYPRKGIPERIAIFALEVVYEAIGVTGFVYPQKSAKPHPETAALAEKALNVTWALLWDSTRYLKNARVVYETLLLWSCILRWSRTMALEEMEKRVVTDLQRVRSIAVECSYSSGVRLVDWALEQSAQTETTAADLPGDLFREVFPDSSKP